MVKKKVTVKQLKNKNIKVRAYAKTLGSDFVFSTTAKNTLQNAQNQIKHQDAKKQLGEAQQVVQKQKSKKSKVKTLTILIANIFALLIALIFQTRKQGIVSIRDLFASNLNYGFFTLAVLTFVLFMLLKSVRFYSLIKHSNHQHSKRPYLSYKTVALGKYYQAITPMSSGQQPFQMFYLAKRGMNTCTAISVPAANYIISRLAWMIVSIFAVIYAAINSTMASAKVVLVIALLSFLFSLLFITFILLSTFSNKFGKIAVAKFLKFLEKIKVIKNYEKHYAKVIKTMEDYQSALKAYVKKTWVLVFNVLLSLFIFFVKYSLLFLIYISLNKHFDASLYLSIVVKAIIIDIAVGAIPLPGGTGVSELFFTLVFDGVFIGGTMFWGMLIWRIFNFYGMLTQGVTILIYDYFIGDKKFKWQKKKWQLESESAAFKSKRLEEYKRNKRKNKSLK